VDECPKDKIRKIGVEDVAMNTIVDLDNLRDTYI